MQKADILTAIKNNRKIHKNDEIREFILSIEDTDKLQLCYILLVSTNYDINKTKTILTLRNRNNINLLMDLLDNKIINENSSYLEEELVNPKSQQGSILKCYDALLKDDRFNLDYEFLKGVLKTKHIQKVIKMIENEDFPYYEETFRSVISSKNNLVTKTKAKFICAGQLEKIEENIALKEGIISKEFKSEENDKKLTNDEFDNFLELCMKNDSYREIYKTMFILVSFDPFKKMGKKLKDKRKILSKKYDLSESHGKKRYNAFINQMKKGEKTRKKLD